MNDYVTINVETSGLYPDRDEIIKIGAVKVKNGKIIDRFSSLVRAKHSLTDVIEEITHITNESLSNALPINEVLSEFLKFIGGNVLVAHNIGFDVKFLNSALKNSGKDKLNNKTIDTVKLARKKCKAERFILSAIARFFGVNNEFLPDEEIVYNIYERLKIMDDLKFPETNENKFCLDGKIFIKNIRKCYVIGKNKRGYDVYCEIPECGEGKFGYEKGRALIESYNKKLWLENGALETLNRAIDEYDREYDDIRARHSGFRVAEWKDCGIKVYYEYSEPGELRFNVYYEKRGVELKTVKRICVETVFSILENYSDGKKIISEDEPIENNPLYLSAVDNKDKTLIAELKYLYGESDKNDLILLEAADGIKRLPRLSKEFDRCYVVDYDLNGIEILNKSKYKFLHHIGAEMKGYTRSKLEINPYEKCVIDAAKTDSPSITFDEFLKLFD